MPRFPGRYRRSGWRWPSREGRRSVEEVTGEPLYGTGCAHRHRQGGHGGDDPGAIGEARRVPCAHRLNPPMGSPTRWLTGAVMGVSCRMSFAGVMRAGRPRLALVVLAVVEQRLDAARGAGGWQRCRGGRSDGRVSAERAYLDGAPCRGRFGGAFRSVPAVGDVSASGVAGGKWRQEAPSPEDGTPRASLRPLDWVAREQTRAFDWCDVPTG